MRRKIYTVGAFAMLVAAPAFATDLKPEDVVVVDKKTNDLYLAYYDDGYLKIRQTFHATLGKVAGDKEREGDLKTPEGIYEIQSRLSGSQLKPIFGPLALYVGYPNTMDKREGKTGFDIMIHGTNDPSRLAKDFDTKGCVALENQLVKEVSDCIKLRDTKVIITNKFKEMMSGSHLPELKKFFSGWLDAWSGKNLDAYISAYADDFKSGSMNKSRFRAYKGELNKKYERISVTAENPHFYQHEKYDLIEFTQIYRSTFKNGRAAYEKHSRKRLWIKHAPDGRAQIELEESRG